MFIERPPWFYRKLWLLNDRSWVNRFFIYRSRWFSWLFWSRRNNKFRNRKIHNRCWDHRLFDNWCIVNWLFFYWSRRNSWLFRSRWSYQFSDWKLWCFYRSRRFINNSPAL